MDSFDPIEHFLESLANPSIMHWLALFLGDWVRGVFNENAVSTNPITALMVSLSMMNIVAMAVVLLILVFVGGRSIFSGLFTANMVAGVSKFMPLRVLIGFALLMPTDAGVDALASYNLTVSNVQSSMVKGIAIGGALADTTWAVTGRALFDFNIGGAPRLRNTIGRSMELAQGFVCAQIYHENLGAKRGESLYYWQVTGGEVQPLDSVSSLNLPNLTNEEQWIVLLLGGAKGQCGVISLKLLPSGDNPRSGDAAYPSVNAFVPRIQGAMRLEAVKTFLGVLGEYEQFGQAFYSNYTPYTANDTLRATIEDESDGVRFEMQNVNVGSLVSTAAGDSLNRRNNAHADALVYLAQRLSYAQVGLVNSATQQIPRMLGGTDNYEDNLNMLSPTFFDDFMSGYISAGLFWSVYQDFSSMAYDVERYMNETSIDLPTFDAGLLCERSWVASLLSSSDDDCENLKLVNNVFSMLSNFAYQKGANEAFTSSINVNSRSYSIDPKKWKLFFSMSRGSQDEESVEGLGIIAKSTVGLFDGLWSTMEWTGRIQSGGTLMGTNQGDRMGLLTGTDALVFNISGQNSPYLMLNQLGEGMRDIAFDLRLARHIMVGTATALTKYKDVMIQEVASSSKLLSMLLIPPSIISEIGREAISDVSSLVMNLVKSLSLAALILIYGVPAIPLVGWIMVILGLFFVFVSAMAASPFAAVLVVIPKGEGLFSPDTERLLSMIYGVVIRQSLTVVGFVAGMYCGYAGLSLVNLLWFTTFLGKLAGMSALDAISAVIFIFVGYAVVVFFVCLYSFRWTTLLVDAVGMWFSSVLVGGAFAAHDGDSAAATQAIKGLSSQLNDIAERNSNLDNPNGNREKKRSTNDKKMNA